MANVHRCIGGLGLDNPRLSPSSFQAKKSSFGPFLALHILSPITHLAYGIEIHTGRALESVRTSMVTQDEPGAAFGIWKKSGIIPLVYRLKYARIWYGKLLRAVQFERHFNVYSLSMATAAGIEILIAG